MQKLSIVLWNTKLSPPQSGKWDKSTDEEKIKVSEVIAIFLLLGYDFICLSEVSPNDVEFLSKVLNIESRGYKYEYKEKKEGNICFDTAIFYKSLFTCLEMNWTLDGENKGVFKAYQYYSFLEKNSNENFIFYLAHLPSLLDDNGQKRRSITSYIRFKINEQKKEDPLRKFIVLGDFNAEPFSHEMIDGLRSSRHQEVVKKNSHLLYNPCWKFLPCNNENPIGTFYYPKGEYAYWQVLDQILFSGNFFKQNWQIKDDNIQILDIEQLANKELGFALKNPSDHLPICAILEK